MEITYIYHSGFLITTDKVHIIVDFYEDSPYLGNSVTDRVLADRNRKIYVLSSHSHYDHFYPGILKWKEQREDITYIFSKEIMDERRLRNDIAVWLDKNDTYQDRMLTIKAYGSTDIGISFLIEIEGRTLFHAGDLNNWHWMDESPEEEWRRDEAFFLREMEDIRKEHISIDVVMFPVDPRLGKEYMRGAAQFIEMINTGLFIPMHFGEEYAAANAFQKHARNKGVTSPDIKQKNQVFSII